MSALIVDLSPVAFLIGEAAPAPFPVPNVPVPNPYHRALRPAGTPGATVGAKRGRPKGGKNKADAKKPGRNARTASAEEAVNNTPSITSMWSPRASTPSPSGSAPSSTANARHRVPAHHLQARPTAAVAGVVMMQAAVEPARVGATVVAEVVMVEAVVEPAGVEAAVEAAVAEVVMVEAAVGAAVSEVAIVAAVVGAAAVEGPPRTAYRTHRRAD